MNLRILTHRSLVLLLLPAMTLARGLPPHPASIPKQDEIFLEELQRRCFQFFWEQANPTNGLIADRARADGSEPGTICSIASIGFGLTGICIADARGWIPRAAAYRRVLTTLRHLWEKQEHVCGFYYHFLDMQTGARVWDCELSSIDTALLMAGVLTARQYYRGTEVERLATRLYERVDWDWMRNGGPTLTMGWTPEGGFLEARWDGYSEHMMLYLMALGSPTHPVPPDTWMKWKREPVITYAGRTYLQCPPLFTHQYSQAWVDFRDKRDAFADYWQNSVLATLAHRQFCYDIGYPPNLWGITASDSANGYRAWGGPPKTPDVDGTVVPCAPGGSIPFAPAECLAALREMQRFTWTRYGFADAFHPHTGWVNPDVIGIDVGITLLMAENYRSGFVWHYFMRNPEIQRAMALAGFRRTAPLTPSDTRYLTTLARDTWRCIAAMVEPKTGLPYDNWQRGEFTSVSNIGLYLTSIVAAHELGFINRREAERRIAQTLASVKRLKTWDGFQQSWNSVWTLQPATHDPWISILDTGNLVGGLITVGQAFPRFRADCDALVNAMQWGRYYDGQMIGGFNTLTGQFNTNWHLFHLASDSRLAHFLAIASGQVPAESWDRLDRSREGTYLKPGWEGGGLFMQYISGLWLDERDTLVGRSAQNFAFEQTNRGFPWGWSASDSPRDGYLGWGRLKENIVTPHASALAIQDFPREVVANLRELERRGARHPRYGFYDAIDVTGGEVAKNFLVLDQSMILISLANYLRQDVIRRHFQCSPLVQRGRALIADYREPYYRHCSLFTLEPRPPTLPAQ